MRCLVLLPGFVAVATATPSQIHLALTADPTEMAVQFSTTPTFSTTESIHFGTQPDNLVNVVSDVAHVNFTDSGNAKYCQQHHIGTMTGLKPSTEYYYQVGSSQHGFSDTFKFTSAPDATTVAAQFPLRFGVWGDMGVSNAQILASVKSEVAHDNFDMILHVGDLAYDLHNDDGHNGDKFMDSIQEMAAVVPYMTDVGNHEQAQSFAHYTERFRLLPNPMNDTVVTDNGEAPNNWFYSHDYGNVHFVSISTEVMFVEAQHSQVRKQAKWLENDLRNVDRTKTPWVVVHGHRPMYCSCDADCGESARMVRTGGYVLHRKYGLEKIFHKYGVDLYLAGHEHNYERMFDVFESKTTQSTVNPPATIHIVTGDAGGPEQHETFKRSQPSRTAFRTDAYGYSRMTVHNDTHLFWEQVETDTDAGVEDVVIDSVWIVQEKHGPF